jgi:hypothetical protein
LSTVHPITLNSYSGSGCSSHIGNFNFQITKFLPDLESSFILSISSDHYSPSQLAIEKIVFFLVSKIEFCTLLSFPLITSAICIGVISTWHINGGQESEWIHCVRHLPWGSHSSLWCTLQMRKLKLD